MTKEFIELYDAVRALEQAVDAVGGIDAVLLGGRMRESHELKTAWEALHLAVDAAQPKIDTMQAGFESCLTPAGPVQADDDDVPVVWPEGTVEMVMDLEEKHSYCGNCGADYRKLSCTDLAKLNAGDRACPACLQLIEEIASGT